MMGKEQTCHEIIQFFNLFLSISLITVMLFIYDCCCKILTFKEFIAQLVCSTVICQIRAFWMFTSFGESPTSLPKFPEEKEKLNHYFPLLPLFTERTDLFVKNKNTKVRDQEVMGPGSSFLLCWTLGGSGTVSHHEVSQRLRKICVNCQLKALTVFH